MQEGQWEIFHNDHSNFYKPCICGHRVKRITYLYDNLHRKIIFIGTTCVKKYGITRHLNNRILIQVLKESLVSFESIELEDRLKTWIESRYNVLLEKVNACSEGVFDYYDIVAPFRRLLNDICELVTEYHFDLILLLKVIERDVESMNESTKHYMVDEYDSDTSISTIEYDDDPDLKTEDVFIETLPELSNNVLDEPENYEEAADTPSELSDNIIDEPENDVGEIIPEVLDIIMNETANDDDVGIISNLSDTVLYNNEPQMEENIDISIDYNKTDYKKEYIYDDDDDTSSEYSAETMVEENDGKKCIPLLISEIFCDGYVCHPNTHMYCTIKMRMHKLRIDLDEHKNHIKKLLKEVDELRKDTSDLHYRILDTMYDMKKYNRK
jgi:hypothetical protein